MNVKACLVALLCLAPLPALAQGFAGMGAESDGFALPDPEVQFSFPEDHGPHPEFRIEWWYVTANLQDADGNQYGIQWTLFRNAMAPGGAATDQAWMGHAAVSTPNGHLYAERLARGGIGQAGVTSEPFEAYIDEWQMAGPDLNNVTLTAQSDQFRYDLNLSADRPFVPQGNNGFSVKSEAGQASHYYSQPFYQIEGVLTLPSGTVQVQGQAWLDREWSSQPLTATQTGWDWVSLHFEDGAKLMGYRLRDQDGDAYTVGTWITSDGHPEPLKDGMLTMEAAGQAEVAGRSVPIAWNIALPSKNLSIQTRAFYPDSWMGTRIPYWEGPVSITGSHKGEGYLEMSGY
ncbi:iron ABC transporter permease [Rhodobacteraceae bacterium]|nr:iron ABC transporter permease [Paracoccaceae bacterium]